jgi:glycosyltransferase involved in cell wall biosynthesis
MLIAFVGRFAPEKNPLLFIEAIARLQACGVLCRGLMLGEGPMLADVRSRIQQLGLSSAIEVGFSQRPAERLLEASVYVSLQRGDNYGSQSLLEAMGAGCAIVASNVGETARLVTPDLGLVVDPTTEQLTAALDSLLRDPARTAAMGTAAARIARTEYTPDRYVAFLESLYARAVDARMADAVAPLSTEDTLLQNSR